MFINEFAPDHIIQEGPYDPGIFKAIFLAGGPGSGKSYVANQLLRGSGLKSVNSDTIYEYLAKKQEFDLGDPDKVASDQGQEIRNRAKDLTLSQQEKYLHGRLGLIIDGTGKDVQKVARQSEELKKLGYETMMIFVNTSLDVAQERNKQRERSVPSEMVEKMWRQVQDNIMSFQQVFGAKNFLVVDNSGGLEDPDRKKNFDTVRKNLGMFIDAKPSTRKAKQWIQQSLKDRGATEY